MVVVVVVLLVILILTQNHTIHIWCWPEERDADGKKGKRRLGKIICEGRRVVCKVRLRERQGEMIKSGKRNTEEEN